MLPISKQKHIPVLPKEVLEYLDPQEGQTYLDATAGYGGHAAAIVAKTKAPDKAVLVDRDNEAVTSLEERFPRARVVDADFLSASQQLVAEGSKFDMILADLGVSSPHLDRQDRGFSFVSPSPLDMRMDQRQELTADQIVNGWSEVKIAQLLKEFGQEPKARQIASLIVRNRPFKTTDQLAAVIARAWPGHSRRHPATRSFQALRIQTNDELEQLHKALPIWLELLEPGGKLVVISFHSLEDRIVKQFFAEHSTSGYEAQLEVLTPKPIKASTHETVLNQRARSAILRAASKIKNKKKGYDGK